MYSELCCGVSRRTCCAIMVVQGCGAVWIIYCATWQGCAQSEVGCSVRD